MPADNMENIDRRDFRRYFLNEVCRSQLLTYEEERELLAAAQAGDLDAVHDLSVHNFRLIVSVANRYMGQGVDRQDLETEGFLGLLEALNRFDLSLPHRFSTYARFWIRQRIVRAIAEQGSTIRLPCGLHDYVRRLYNEAQRQTQQTGDHVDPRDVVDIIGEEYGPKTLDRGLAANRFTLSLDWIPDDSPEEDTLGDSLADHDAPDPAEEVHAILRSEKVHAILQRLPFRERMVIVWRFGLRGEQLTFTQCGVKLGVTRERARQIEGEALHRLRHPVHARKLRACR